MDETSNLKLPYILAAQAQKHVTHNEALRKLDALVQISIVDRDLSSPPPTPAEGARYVVAASPTGAWTGSIGRIAAWQDGAWAIYQPRKGWLVWIEDEGIMAAWNGSAWVSTGGSVNPAPLVGVNATADTTNRLVVSSMASLFSHAGAGHQMKINKNAVSDTGSVLFQTGFSGRAEMGLAGSDNFSFKVSPDGANWFDAISINRSNGQVSFPNTSIGGGGGVSDGDKGDVTVSGSGATWTIDAGAVTNAKLATVATATIKGRATAGTGAVEDLTPAQARSVLGVRDVLTANRTYFVRTDGNDANTGLANTAGGAFLTIQRAIDVVATLDLNGFNVVIQVASGTLTQANTLKEVVGYTAPGCLIIRGDTATPSNVVISTTSANGFTASFIAACWRIEGFRIQAATSGIGIRATAAAVQFGSIDFGACATAHIVAEFGASVVATASYSISGSAAWHWFLQGGGTVNITTLTITLTGTPAFSSTFCQCSSSSYANVPGLTFNGSATGLRYNVVLNGVVNTNGGGANYLPGSVAGATSSGGQYV